LTNNGKNGWFVGGHVTIADFKVAELVGYLTYLKASLAQDCPILFETHFNRIRSFPDIAKYENSTTNTERHQFPPWINDVLKKYWIEMGTTEPTLCTIF